MKTVTDVNTVNQLLTYSKQAEAGIHQKAIQMLLGVGNNKKQDSLSISDAARGFSKQSIAALPPCSTIISKKTIQEYYAANPIVRESMQKQVPTPNTFI